MCCVACWPGEGGSACLCFLATIFYLILFHLIEHKYLKNNRPMTKTTQNVFIYVRRMRQPLSPFSFHLPRTNFAHHIRREAYVNAIRRNGILSHRRKKSKEENRCVSVRHYVVHNCYRHNATDGRSCPMCGARYKIQLSLTVHHLMISFVHCFTVMPALRPLRLLSETARELFCVA